MPTRAPTSRPRSTSADAAAPGDPDTRLFFQADDPVPFPELGKAYMRSGKGTGSAACKAAPERPESTPTIALHAALLPSIPLARRTRRRQWQPRRDVALLAEARTLEGRGSTPTLREAAACARQ